MPFIPPNNPVPENYPRMFGSLQEAHDRLEAIIENSHDGIYITDGQAVTIRANRAYETITGLKVTEVLGRSMWEMERDGLLNRSGTLIALAKREPVTLEQTFKTGRRALITSTPVFDDQGDVVMVVTNVRDMTEFYNLQDRFRENEALTQRYHSELALTRQQVLDTADLVVADHKMVEIIRLAQRVAALDATVLLLGETGVGKEQIAKYIYKKSGRKDGPFLTVNCGGLAPDLLERELFGQGESGGEAKLGAFELAHGGTLFLDEVSQLPLELQVKLLRVLQEGVVERLNGSVSVDVRLLVATNYDLEAMVAARTFRQDLYYQLNVAPLTIPPLRERRGDILPFVLRFLEEYNEKYYMKRAFSPSALQALQEYQWPGNVREVRNVVERTVIVAPGDWVEAQHLPIATYPVQFLDTSEGERSVNLKAITAQLEYQFIRQAYQSHGNVRRAAASLGMDAATFVRKRKKYEKQLLVQE